MEGSGTHRLSLVERQFFSLLRAGLWNEVPDAELFAAETDWEALYKLSFEQTVVGHVTDGINCLPKSVMPQEEERMDPFIGDMLTTAQRNGLLDHFIPSLFRALNSIPVLLVKGQGVGRDYLNPARRQPGDIDLLVRPEDYEAAKSILLPKATKVLKEETEIYHQGMKFKSVEVEIHGSVSTLMSPALDRRLSALQAECFSRGTFPTVEIGGERIPVPEVHFNALYIFTHFLHHYWSGGLGLRQIADWTTFLSVHKRDLDPEWLREQLQTMHLLNVWQTFTGFAVEYLGCAPEKLPLYCTPRPDVNLRIWQYIRKCGNFGKVSGRGNKRPDEPRLTRKWNSFWRLVVADRLRHFRVFPRESLRFFAGAFRYGLNRLAKGE